MMSQKCADIFVLNFAYLFRTQLCKSVLLCAVFTWHTTHCVDGSADFRNEFCNCTKSWFYY